jgi:hydroxymethylpyrimidine pyrophosphatase-like HAD family hydrolase
MRSAYPDAKLIAIGDGTTDAELRSAVDELWAVGNAHNDLKKVADRTANETITGGVLELLETWET